MVSQQKQNPPPFQKIKKSVFGEIVSLLRMPLALICLPFLCVEAHAEAERIDGEREDYCRTLLCRDRIECLQKPDVNKQSPERWQPNPTQVDKIQLKTGSCGFRSKS